MTDAGHAAWLPFAGMLLVLAGWAIAGATRDHRRDQRHPPTRDRRRELQALGRVTYRGVELGHRSPITNYTPNAKKPPAEAGGPNAELYDWADDPDA